jgi:hypothetical protein
LVNIITGYTDIISGGSPLVVVEVVPEAVKLVGAVGVLVSTAGAAVVRFALLLEAEMFPAAFSFHGKTISGAGR